MKTEVSPLRKRAVALATIALITTGCAGLPSVRGVNSMSLIISPAPLAGPRVAVMGESDMGPGKAAKAVIPPPEACGGIGGIVCVVGMVVAVPIAAAVGAAVKTSQRLPLEQAEKLNRVTADVASQLNLAASFRTALHAEAQRRGVTLNANSDAEILVAPQSLSWDISAGNNVAVRMEINITLRRASEQGSRQVTYRGASAKVDDWISAGGQPIRQSLEETMVGISRVAWDRILGPESSRIR